MVIKVLFEVKMTNNMSRGYCPNMS